VKKRCIIAWDGLSVADAATVGVAVAPVGTFAAP